MSGDTAFTGGIPDLYERLLVPMIFEKPAGMLAAAVLEVTPHEILETACGTGVLTRALLRDERVQVTATDLNQPMLDAARALTTDARVAWQVADALELPLPDEGFDAVACQFGAMFFPDKTRGYAEALRVLRPGGRFAFNVWDRIELNPVPEVVAEALCAVAPGESLDFVRRTPHGYFDTEVIRRELVDAGFEEIEIEHLSVLTRTTAAESAVAFCQGTPLRGFIERSSLGLERATVVANAALVDQYGEEPFDWPIAWLQITAHRPLAR